MFIERGGERGKERGRVRAEVGQHEGPLTLKQQVGMGGGSKARDYVEDHEGLDIPESESRSESV